MKARIAVVGAILLGTALWMFVPLKAVFLTPTALTQGLSDPIGIDWNSQTNELIVSINWPDGDPANYTSINRASGAASPWGLQSGWADEIYFTTVRQESAALGWPLGHVFSAQAAAPPAADTLTQYIAEFDENGGLVAQKFATLPGEVRLKRGGITFDRFDVPGLNGAMVVVASNDLNNVGAPFPAQDTVVYKITSAGVVTQLATLSGHSEGVAVIPTDAKYGTWAGKILIGREPTLAVVALDPVTLQVSAPYNIGFEVEDIWVIPAGADFYGVDHREDESKNGPGIVYKIDAKQWSDAGLAGKVVFAEEHGAHLTVAQSPVSGNETILNTNPQIQWEHITFAPGPPAVDIIKYTNNQDANVPDGADVPNVAVGGAITWKYLVTNTGGTSVPRANVVVTDNVTGVSPAYSSEQSGNGDTIFNPGEVWIYTAAGTALNLANAPPAGNYFFVAGKCTHGGLEPPRTAYTNIGTVTIPGATDSDPSSYCNPPPNPNVSIVKYTNGADANDPNGNDVPDIAIGGTVTWTYKVTNTGAVSVPKAQVIVTDDTNGVTPAYDSEISGNGDAIFNPAEVWLYKATGIALNLASPPPAGTTFVNNVCTKSNTRPAATAYKNMGTVTIPGASASDPSSYCNSRQLPCPAGSFIVNKNASGDFDIVYDQFPAPNDNSYGVNAVGWGTKGHTFGNLTGSDKAGFQVRNGTTVVLSFTIDYLTTRASTSPATPSGYISLGPFGGDGDLVAGTLQKNANGTSNDITWDTSLARNLNNTGYFVGGVQVVGKTVADLLVNSPPTLNTTDSYTLTPAAAAVFTAPNPDSPDSPGWNFHDTYFVTIKKAKLQAMGALDASGNLKTGWVIEPNESVLHNSPAKACPTSTGGGGSCDFTILDKKIDKKEVQIKIKNNSTTVDEIISALQVTWPAANGKLVQVKLDGDVIYDNPDIAAPSANLTTAQLVADQNKRKIQKNSDDTLYLIFEKDADKDFTKYTGKVSFGTNCDLTILP